MAKRVLLITVSLVVAVALLGSLLIWLALAEWVPVKGKALLIQELEKRAPITVTIGSIRYEPIHGFVLNDVRAVGPAQDVWCVIPAMNARVDWFTLPLTRSLAFRGRALLESPGQTVIVFSGRYHLATKALTLNGETTDLPLRSLTTPLRRLIPTPLTDGSARLQVHVAQASGALPTVTGRLIGTGLIWQGSPWRATGDVTLNGTAVPPSAPGGRWSLQGLAALSRGQVDDAPIVGAVTQLKGTARVSQERIEIEELSGVALDSVWTLEGDLALQPLAVEALLTSRIHLAPLASAFPQVGEAWQPQGMAEMRVVCRGPLAPQPLLDCLARARLEDATLAGRLLDGPLTNITGTLGFDWLAQTVSIDALSGRLERQPFHVSGDVRIRRPLELALHADGTVPLAWLSVWLPTNGAISGLSGTAAFDVALNGPLPSPQILGTVSVDDAAAQWMTPPLLLEHLSGSARLSPEAIEIPEATMRLNDQPLTMSATITPPPPGRREIPALKTAMRFPQGQLWLTGHVTPEEVVIEEGHAVLTHSQLRFDGALGRRPERESRFSVSGGVELSELSHLPFLPLPVVEHWKLEGLADVEAQFQGQLSDWPSAAIRGRLTSEHLSARTIPMDQLSCTIEQSHGVLHVRIPSGLIAQGHLQSELTVEHLTKGTDYALQADLTGLQLAALTEVVPMWNARTVVGQASAHAVVSGTWERPASWRGEGWVNANGERLGDVPLLDKVFRGLFGVLSDRLGLDMLRRAQITQASVQWQLAEERFVTDDLRLAGFAGTEPIAIYADGSVGFDQTLDFTIEPELSEGVVLQAPTTSTLAGTVLKAAGQLERLRRLIGRHRLTGTLKDPSYRFEVSTKEILKQLAPSPVDFLQNIFQSTR